MKSHEREERKIRSEKWMEFFVDQIGLDWIEYAFLKDDDSKRLIWYLGKRLGEVTITIYQQRRINYGIMDTVQ